MNDEPARVVFDCNVFLQGAANRNSPARQALRLFFAGRITLFVNAAVLRELRDVLYRPTLRRKLPGLSDRLVDALLQKIESRAVLLANVPKEFHYERDPKDERYINLAIVANAIFLVSKDTDLLALTQVSTEDALRFRNRYPFLRVLTPAEFATEMEQRNVRVEAADE